MKAAVFHVFMTVTVMLTAFVCEAATKKAPPATVLSNKVAAAPAASADWSLSQNVVEKDAQIQILNTLTCSIQKPSPCLSLCQGSTCEWVEPTCRDCFGTSSEVLRDVFTRLLSTHTAEAAGSDASSAGDGFIRALTSVPMILLGTQSPYDFFNSSQDQYFKKALELTCGSQMGFVAVSLDEDGRPLSANFAICGSRIVRLSK